VLDVTRMGDGLREVLRLWNEIRLFFAHEPIWRLRQGPMCSRPGAFFSLSRGLCLVQKGCG